MTDKHTPGPWYIRTNRHPETDGRPWGWLDAAPPGGPQRNIPGVTVTWTRGCTSEANARLIAAAPDLLEVVQKYLAWARAEDDHEGTTFWDRVDMYREVDALAKAAITKATGEGA